MYFVFSWFVLFGEKNWCQNDIAGLSVYKRWNYNEDV